LAVRVIIYEFVINISVFGNEISLPDVEHI
jgi:hypothetical protein